MIDSETGREVSARLSKIEGQIKGVRRMVEEGRYCVDILHQISAIQAALNRVAQRAMKRHLESCVAEAFQSKDKRERGKKVEELMEMFSRFGK
ncbi:MAG TPA: metal-sensitive transcriptional regulator [Candidatus Manganitrophaceae bacterium]|nr:metal-sensitive transcriptional regulator [Candidatus Manganitrophaceae bacterium]